MWLQCPISHILIVLLLISHKSLTVLLISRKSNFTKGKVTLGCIRFITYLSSTWIILLNYTSLSLFAKFYQLSKIILESQNWLSAWRGKKLENIYIWFTVVYCTLPCYSALFTLSFTYLCLVWIIQIALDGSKLFWSGPNHFWLVLNDTFLD